MTGVANTKTSPKKGENTPVAERHHNYELSMANGTLSILPQRLRDFMAHATARVLPGSCLLCGADSEDVMLCAPCAADLPPPAPARCPQCAEPTTHGERCGACLKDEPAFARTFAVYRYGFPVDRLVQALKYGHQLAPAAWFGERIARMTEPAAHDRVMPMPLHSERLRERGFNQAAEIARHAAAALGLPLDLFSLSRTRPTPAQATLPLKERSANVRGAFACSTDLGGSRVLLVDDVMTSGATVRECARILRLHGAAEVCVGVAARAVRP
jgi:ComF family protein